MPRPQFLHLLILCNMQEADKANSKKRKRSLRMSKWTTGDFELISSDNVSFRTETHRLLTWS